MQKTHLQSQRTNRVRDDDMSCSGLAKSDVGGYLYEAEYVILTKTLKYCSSRKTVSDSRAGGHIQGTCWLQGIQLQLSNAHFELAHKRT